MTATLDRATSEVMYPVLKPVAAFVNCARCWHIGRAEWLPNGTVRVLHHGTDGNYICVIQLPLSHLPDGTTEVTKALLLLR